MKEFEKFGLSPELIKAIERMGIEKPTMIQEKSIPIILKGQDVIGESATGSGKTLAFGTGIIEKIVPRKGLQALVLTPTRELAEQVKKSIMQMAYQKHLSITSIYGGVSYDPQLKALRTAEVVVATPGRLLDHIQRRNIDLSKVNILVLDEADRMFDMGFIGDVEKIIRNCAKQRQTLLFFATWSDQVERVARTYLKNPVKVTATKMVDPTKLKQVYYDIPKNLKMSLLVHLIANENSKLVMVFCNTRRTTDFVAKILKSNKVDAVAIHGGFSQNKRTKTMEIFNKAKANVLICTDVAARGLHINNVSHIYNYEIPKDPTEYVHRIGRTARAGEEGRVINLVADNDHENFSRVYSQYRNYNIESLKAPMLKRIEVSRDQQPRRQSFSKHKRKPYRGQGNGRPRRRR